MTKTLEERKEFAAVIGRAWVDEEFKKRLLDDPATVRKENGIEVPEGMTVRVVERKENEVLLTNAPKTDEMTEEQLEKIAAGVGGGSTGHDMEEW